MAMRMADAATPRIASTRRSHPGARALGSGPGGFSSPARGDLFQFLAELGEDAGGVQALDAGLLHPVLDDRGGALLHLGDQGGIGVDDLDAGLLERLEASLVGVVPRAPGVTRDPLAGDLLERLLVLPRQLVPLVLVHEEAERRAV